MVKPRDGILIDCIKSLISEQPQSRRYERKCKLRYGQSLYIESELRALGFHETYMPRSVSSIYFDDESFSFAKANLDGIRYRIKPRLRWYNAETNNATLELKYRDGFNGYKKQFAHYSFNKNNTSYSAIIGVIQEELRNALHLSNLLPSSQVNYDRRYFEHASGIRATIDTCITVNTPGFTESIINQTIPLGFEVLEIKYIPRLDNYIREFIYPSLSRLSIRLTKCSKYVESIKSVSDNVMQSNLDDLE
jgi:hypothetical protein